MRTVARERQRFANEGLTINVVFHIPGPMFQPDYAGVHATRLDRKNEHLLVVAAVPADLSSDQTSSYIADVLRAADRQARAYLHKRRISIKLDQVEGLIDHLVGLLEAPAN